MSHQARFLGEVNFSEGTLLTQRTVLECHLLSSPAS